MLAQYIARRGYTRLGAANAMMRTKFILFYLMTHPVLETSLSAEALGSRCVYTNIYEQ